MFHLQRNLPGWERALRLALAALTTAAVLLAPPLGPWLMAAGLGTAAMLAGTAFIGFCPACAMVGRRAP